VRQSRAHPVIIGDVTIGPRRPFNTNAVKLNYNLQYSMIFFLLELHFSSICIFLSFLVFPLRPS
jgi:hypothetical protein